MTINCSQEFEPEAREDLTHSLRGVKEAMRQIWGKQGRLGGIYKGGWGEERKFLLYVSGEMQEISGYLELRVSEEWSREGELWVLEKGEEAFSLDGKQI